MITIACVLRSGGVYAPEWVWALKRGLHRHLPLEIQWEFRVLSDLDCFGPWGNKLDHRWPGWWAKMELFRPGLFNGPVLYLDLDTLIVGDLTEIASYSGDPLALLSDFYRPYNGQSGMMMWTPGPQSAWIWDNWVRQPDYWMRNYHGDGNVIDSLSTQYPEHVNRLQDLFPEQIVSYKVHARLGMPTNARVVCFHGYPKPNNKECGWAYAEWLRR